MFANKWQYKYHKNVECKQFASHKNTCMFQTTEGKCCGQTFKQVATLIAHSYDEHKKITCAQCYYTLPYEQKEQFDNHIHDERVDVRASK